LGTKPNTNKASPIRARFLMMYCPIKVGQNRSFQASSGRKNKGRNVVIIWPRNTQKAILVAEGINHKIPSAHSKRPNNIENWGIANNSINVLSYRCMTNSSAGETPKTFRAPNQKKIRNKERRPNQ